MCRYDCVRYDMCVCVYKTLYIVFSLGSIAKIYEELFIWIKNHLIQVFSWKNIKQTQMPFSL
jgi:hypothetical protein